MVDEIKGKVAMSNGTSERAIDAFSRAYTLGQAPAYKAKVKTNIEGAYRVRFGKMDGMDGWIMTAVAKPFVNPSTPIEPIKDPEPVAPVTQPTTPPTTTPGSTVRPPVTTQTKPATSAPAKPTAPPAKTPGKPSASVKKPVAKKKTV